ncbi:MAG: hypothetical protein R3E90_02030 [Marinicella sp.]
MEFEFNFGEQTIAKAPPKDLTLFASVAGTVQQLSKDELVFMDHRHGNNHVMTLQVLQAMGLTQQFKPMHEHIQVIEQNIPELRGQQTAIEKVLGFLKDKQLLLSETQWLEQLKTSSTTREVPYAGLVIRTCQRPDNLRRLLDSLNQYQLKHGVEHTVLVFDDSSDDKSQDENKKVCQDSKVNVKYHGKQWQQQFISMLSQQFPEDTQQIKWLLAEQAGFTGGRVWNLAILALAGKKFAFYDDDYLIQPRKVQASLEDEVNLNENTQLSVGFGLNIRAIKELSHPVESDVLGQMANACGNYFGHWWRQEGIKSHSSLYGWRLVDLERLNSESVIKSTGNGTWGSPRAESNYWLFLLKGEEREAFWQDRETYLDNIEASNLLHYTANFAALSLSYFAPSTIDNSTLTPYVMPINKNEDHFFNCMMQGCYPDQVSLHFPVMMGHIQTTTRDRSSFNHLARRPNFNNFVADYVLAVSTKIHTKDVAVRYDALRSAIDDLCSSSDMALELRLREYMTKTRADLVYSLQNIMEEVPDAPIYWQADVREIIQANGKAIKNNPPPVLSDWDASLSLENCIVKVRHDLKEVVDAMKVWPKLWNFCLGQ